MVHVNHAITVIQVGSFAKTRIIFNFRSQRTEQRILHYYPFWGAR